MTRGYGEAYWLKEEPLRKSMSLKVVTDIGAALKAAF
jgi:hypothetical protein